MGRRECYERDVHHVGKHSRPTPRLTQVIFYLLFDLLSHRWSCARILTCFSYFSVVFEQLFEFSVLSWNTCFVIVGSNLPVV